MYLISYKMIYGVDLQRCVFTGNREFRLEKTECPTLLKILRSIVLYDK